MQIKISAVICAAGKGERAGFGKNKLLVPLNGEPALHHTLKKFAMPEIDEVVITASADDYDEICALARPFNFKVVAGGQTRTESVKRALDAVTGDIVLIHDGARPYVTKELILKCIDSVISHKSGICAVKATDTAVYADGDICERLNRDSLYLVQTPQGFFTEDIRRAYALAGDGVYTDDSAVYGKYIRPAHIVEGEKGNIKLTERGDFDCLPPLPHPHSATARVGMGVDVHAFGEGDFVVLCGQKIDCDSGLVAHSDGDVPVHALMDALLAAAGLKDIGHYFPDSDPKYRNADSMKMLESVVGLVRGKGYKVINTTISIQAQKPRLAKYIDAMVNSISGALGIPAADVAVAAGTAEGLGFVGEGLGICAYATVALKEV